MNCAIGIDSSAADAFKICTQATLASAPRITILTDGKIGIGDITPGVGFANIGGTGTNVGAAGIYWN